MQIKRHLNAIAISLTGAAMIAGSSTLAARHSATTAAEVGLQEPDPNLKRVVILAKNKEISVPLQ